MLEKIGLPARPSLRGNNWVVDASHCQGCSSQFTFINRKHHCRRCGGIFCNSCTQHRMVLRGQGDSPVRICEPCKKLEEAARFELRHGHKSRTGRGSLKSTKPEDDILAEILGSDRKESSSSVQELNGNSSSSGRTVAGEEFVDHGEGEASSSLTDRLENKMESSSPEQLRQQALDEKKKYRVLKGEGKSEEALKAFKRGKELERKADALEISIRRSRRNALVSSNACEDQNVGSKESGRKMKLNQQSSNEKHDLNAELKELGWSEMDLHAEDKKSATMSLEGELSSLLSGVSQKTDKAKGVHSIDNTQVVAHKRKALMLKREGKLTEAKEELKKAKVLEKQLEEQELLAGAEDESDDELSALVRSLDDNKHEDISFQYKENLEFDLDNLLGAANTIISDINFEVTDEDMEDPEISAALETLGWTEDSNNAESTQPQPSSSTRDSIKSEIISLKREALNQKRAGNIAVAMEQLKKAKILERDLENFGSQEDKHVSGGGSTETTEVMIPKLPSKSKVAIQKELLAIKKKALSLRREGRLDEAEKELNKCKVLEHQLEQAAEASRGNGREVGVETKNPHLLSEDLNKNLLDVEVVEDVTDQEMHDPEYLSVLKNLGWNDKDDDLVPSKPSKQDDLLDVEPSESSANHAPKYAVRPLRKKAEVQRELLGLKRKALSLRRQGETEAADEVLLKTKALEAEMEEIESRDRVRTAAYSGNQEDNRKASSGRLVNQGDDCDVTEEDMSDPSLLSVLQNLGWNGDDVAPVIKQVNPVKEDAKPSSNQSSTTNVTAPQSRSEIQREVLNLKRKALSLRRKGDIDEAEEVLRRAKVLEIQMDELDTPKPKGVVGITEDDKSEVLRALGGDELRDRVKDVEVNNVSAQVADGLKVYNEVPDLSMDLKSSKGNSVHSRLQNFNQSDRLDSKELGASFRESTSGRNSSLEGKIATDAFSSNYQPAENVDTYLILNNWIFHVGNGRISHSDVLTSVGLFTESGSQAISTVTNKDHFSIVNQDTVVHEGKEHYQADSSFQDSNSQSSTSSLRQEVLARKKKAVALKREGKLSEAREELRHAKLMEKSLEENNGQVQLTSKSSSISSNNVPSPSRKESSTSTVEQKPSPEKQSSPSTMEQKPMSARDRFKLQQESLKHKRQALKFRREGRTQEADAEFEKAKAIETQLEQLTNATNSSASGEEHAGDVSVEDFLDPQLLSALRAIGLEDPTPSISRGQDTLKPPPKAGTDKMENPVLERNQLEERIKAEKMKAVNLKRSGKQAEALDALRRAKLYEKKLNALVSN
ncbi:putative Phosphoinositide binding [Cucumis melo var. makuwa]|uniref:Phosphoinositide binding n=1 Tax=Cucumis melo var. makuwa TaxID=1194695 RepID=A0A5A7U9Z7_CUCMM|nr:putative Phosphoinositide binding [Cucumis melo var. makuwa]